jgi:hypothetical protein
LGPLWRAFCRCHIARRTVASLCGVLVRTARGTERVKGAWSVVGTREQKAALRLLSPATTTCLRALLLCSTLSYDPFHTCNCSQPITAQQLSAHFSGSRPSRPSSPRRTTPLFLFPSSMSYIPLMDSPPLAYLATSPASYEPVSAGPPESTPSAPPDNGRLRPHLDVHQPRPPLDYQRSLTGSVLKSPALSGSEMRRSYGMGEASMGERRPGVGKQWDPIPFKSWFGVMLIVSHLIQGR